MLTIVSPAAPQRTSLKSHSAKVALIAALCAGTAFAGVATLTIFGRTFIISTSSKPVIKPAVKAPTGGSTTSPSPSPVPVPLRSGLGLNLTSAIYYSGERALMNLAQGSGGWMWQASWSAPWGMLDTGRLDGADTVKSLNPGEVAHLPLLPPEGAYGTAPVRVRCSWTGKGTLAPGGIVSAVSQGANSFEFDWAPAKNGEVMPARVTLSATDPSDPVRKIDCREKSASTTARFSPDFVQSLAGYRLVRFLDWQNVNQNATVTWATRPTLDSQDQSGARGVAVEYMVGLANEAGVDPWFTMPWNADDTYIRRFAEYVRDNLASGRVAYVEMSNEVWNYAFPVTGQARDEGLAAGLSTNPHEAMLRRYAEKSAAMHRIWTDVFKANPGRLVRVVSVQSANAWTAETVLGFRDTAQYVDAVATAPYFGGALFDDARAGWTNLDQIFAWLDADVDAAIARGVESKAIATRFGKRSIAYEGGQHILNRNNLPLLKSIQRDPRMYDLYKKYLSGWQKQVGDTMTLFNSTSPISQHGAWGLREYAGQPLAQTPKRRAAVDYNNAVY